MGSNNRGHDFSHVNRVPYYPSDIISNDDMVVYYLEPEHGEESMASIFEFKRVKCFKKKTHDVSG